MPPSEKTNGDPRKLAIPLQDEMEETFQARVVTYEDGNELKPGGMCGCCGTGPKVAPEWRGDPWYIYRAGMCDADGHYYSMLCEDCLESIRAQNSRRVRTERDEIADEVRKLMGDDDDGAQAFMDDLL